MVLPAPPPPLPRDFCVGLDVQASKETARTFCAWQGIIKG